MDGLRVPTGRAGRASAVALSLLLAVTAQMVVIAPPPVAATGLTAANVRVTGTVGVVVDGAATAGPTGYTPLRVGRFVGDPAPAGYVHTYQWLTPAAIVASPETAPLVLAGTLDVGGQATGSVALIGFLDAGHVAANAGYQSGAYVYVWRTATTWVVGPSDGNMNAEVVQAFHTIPAATVAAAGNLIGIVLTVDGTVADPAPCASTPYGTVPGGSVPAGCLTLDVTVGGTALPRITDTYGEITVRYNSSVPIETPYVDHVEFGQGAVFGWDNSPGGGLNGVAFDLVADVDGLAPAVSGVAVTPTTVYPGQPVELTAGVVAQGAGESLTAVRYTTDGGTTWTAMTATTGDGWTATFAAPTAASYPADVEVCVQATDGLSGTAASDETSGAGAACVTLVVVEPHTSGPAITDVGAAPTPVTFGGDVVLSADVADAAGVSAVEYSLDSGATWSAMSLSSGDAYDGTYVATVVRPYVGTYVAGFQATDTYANATTAAGTAMFVVTPAQLGVTYDGQFVDPDGGSTTLSATVSGPAGCTTGATVRFTWTDMANPADVTTRDASTNAMGVASVTTTLVIGDLYDVEAAVLPCDLGGSADPEALGDTDVGTTVSPDPNAASGGGGWYKTSSPPPKVSFGYTLRAKYVKRTATTTYSGNLLWVNNDVNRLKGTLTSYGAVTCPTVGSLTFTGCREMSGTGTLYDANPAYDPADPESEAWINPRTVTFTFTVADGGTASLAKKGGPKQAKPDAAGLWIDGESVPAESDPIALNGGNLVVR